MRCSGTSGKLMVRGGRLIARGWWDAGGNTLEAFSTDMRLG